MDIDRLGHRGLELESDRMKDPYLLDSVVLNYLSFSEIKRLNRIGQDIANKNGTSTLSEVVIRMLLKGIEQYEAEMDKEARE